jgi:hypothetical protein
MLPVQGNAMTSAATTTDPILAAIRDANYRQGGLRCLRLLRVDDAAFAALREEVLALCRDGQPSDVGDEHHTTHWTRPRGEVKQYSLLNRSGRFDDFSDDHDHSCIGKRFAHGDRYPALAGFVASFPHAVNMRINALGPRATLSAHKENAVFRANDGTVAICARFHLPVAMASEAEIILEDQVFSLERGIVHFVNHGCVHAARNRGAATRLHLVWDMLLTREATALMFGKTPPPAGMAQLPAAARPVPVLRTERMGAANLLRDLVDVDAAQAVAYCTPQ